MDKEKILKVEEYIKSQIDQDSLNIENIATIKNRSFKSKDPKYLTILTISDKKTGLQNNINFNTLKLYRELIKQEKYGKFNQGEL